MSTELDKFDLPCDCAGTCLILRFERYKFYDDPSEYCVEIFQHWPRSSFRYRLRSAWRILIGHPDNSWNDITITNESKVAALRDWLNMVLADSEEALAQKALTEHPSADTTHHNPARAKQKKVKGEGPGAL